MSDHFINIFVYADDIVLIAPSWRALQQRLNVLQDKATAINMECNVKKTVAVVFPPKKSS